jgi:hypothetical protein
MTGHTAHELAHATCLTIRSALIEEAYDKCLVLEAKHEQVAQVLDVRLHILICAGFLGYI